MEHKHHYSGLTDSQVLESRRKNGANILTPPEEQSIWDKIKDCLHFWLLKVLIGLTIVSCAVIAGLKIASIAMPAAVWIAPVILIVLFLLTYVVAFLGGDWDEDEKKFDMDPLITILLAALVLSGAISFYQGVFGGEPGIEPYFEPIGIAVAVLLATGVAYILESQNEKTFKSLNEVNDETLVKVIRNDNVCQVQRKDIVVGDIVILEAGEEVPADCELLEALNLNINESSLTGEPQCAKTTDPAQFDSDATYPSNHIMKGCTIIEGYCTAKVFAVGDSTASGKVFEAAQVKEGDATPLSKKLDQLASLITKISYVLAILIVLGRLVRYAVIHPASSILSLCCFLGGSLIIADIIFAILQKKKMGRFKDVFTLAFETIGGLFVKKDKSIDKDKIDSPDGNDEDNSESLELWQVLEFMIVPTIGIILYFAVGTGEAIWKDLIKYALDSVMIAVTLIVVAVPEGLPMAVTLSLAFSMKRLMKQNTLPRTMHACETMGATSVICTDKTGTLTKNKMEVYETYFPSLCNQELRKDEISGIIEEALSVNTTANLDYAKATDIKSIGNPTEGALLLWLHKNGINYLLIREDVEIVDRLPFTTELKYMATIVDSRVFGKRVVYVKGAPEIIMGLCQINADERSRYDSKLEEYQSKAMRTLGFAYSELSDKQDVFLDGKLNVNSLKMLGVVAISDPVRDDVPAAIKECLDAGILVKIVTGDTPGTAKEIGRQVGLWTDKDTNENILVGKDIEEMSDNELEQRLPSVKIISRARPNDKERVVRILKKLDYVVAVTGDGTNDAPALNAANVGLSMGDGTAVAKEASDMTILDNSFSTIANAVMWGRSLYKNIKRFILFQMTVNVAACLIVLVGAFIGTESPLTVTQMLWVNLIMDTFAALALASLPPTHSVMKDKPRSVNEHILKGMGSGIIGVGLTFFFILLAALLFLQHTDVYPGGPLFPKWGAYNGLSLYEEGLFFTLFVMLQFWNLFNAKAFMTNGSAFKGISWRNTKWFILIALIIFFGQVLIVEFGGEMFNVAKGGLCWNDWLFIVGGTSLVLWVGEIVRAVRKRQNNCIR